jgi:hypothetical protein
MTMLQAHSFLWHYLWVAPNVLLLGLAFLAWQRKLQKQFPVFVTFAVLSALEQFAVYTADVAPSVTAESFWRIFWAGLLIEALVKFALVGEIFVAVFGQYASVARLGKVLIRAVGVILVFVAVLTAAYAPKDSLFGIVSGAHILEQTIYIIECGFLLFIFLFAAYFRLTWNSSAFGIAFGLSISACVHLATWAVMANGGLLSKRYLLDFVNMGTYHVCVLVWFYYLLVPETKATTSAVPLPEHNLELWNRELERLLQP